MPGISFKGVIKINTPYEKAKRLAHAANWSSKYIFGEKDVQKAWAWENGASDSFIFTKDDAKKFEKSYYDTYDRIDRAHTAALDDDLVYAEETAAWEAHARNVQKIVDSADEIKELNINKEGRYHLDFID